MLRVLVEHAGSLQPKLLQLGYIFCLLGYGTKAGVFPLHSWLPDAHSEAPAPASAMLSGALLNCALFAICRITELVKLTSHHDLATTLPIAWGHLRPWQLLFYCSFINLELRGSQACSSIENVGIMLVAIGLGSPALFFPPSCQPQRCEGGSIFTLRKHHSRLWHQGSFSNTRSIEIFASQKEYFLHYLQRR